VLDAVASALGRDPRRGHGPPGDDRSEPSRINRRGGNALGCDGTTGDLGPPVMAGRAYAQDWCGPRRWPPLNMHRSFFFRVRSWRADRRAQTRWCSSGRLGGRRHRLPRLSDALARGPSVAVGCAVGLRRPMCCRATFALSMQAERITVLTALTGILQDTQIDVKVRRQRDSDVGAAAAWPGGDVHGPARQSGFRLAGTVSDAVTPTADRAGVGDRGQHDAARHEPMARGRFGIAGVAPGSYRVTVRRLGYISDTKAVRIADDSSRATVDFILQATPTRLNEVVTTAVGDQPALRARQRQSRRSTSIRSRRPRRPPVAHRHILSGARPWRRRRGGQRRPARGRRGKRSAFAASAVLYCRAIPS